MPSNKKVDLIVHHAVVQTVDENFSTHQAFAVTNGRFVAVGSNEEILTRYEADRVIDAQGKYIYPGFIDAHCHFFGYGYNIIKRVDLVGTTSFEECILRLKNHYDQFKPEWLEGRGWDQNDWEVKVFPDKARLDEIFPDVPVYLTRIDGHAAIVNSEALRRAGIDASTIQPGGEIVVKDGHPTGLLIDNAMDLVANLISQPDEFMIRKMLLEAQRNCFAVGLTSVQDAGLDMEIVTLIDQMHQEGILKIRIYAMLSPSEQNIKNFVEHGPRVTDRLSVRSVKLYADGALGSRGASLLEPYHDEPGKRGIMIHDPEYYHRLCKLAIANDFQVNTHAIGDAGNRFVLNLYGEHLKGPNDKRWRIEHCQIIHPEDFSLFGKYDIIPSVQPTHATSDMYWAGERLGPDRIRDAYAYKQLLSENGWIALGTDFPVENINPVLTFYAAISRRDLNNWPEGGFQPENALTRQDALRGMTLWAAKAAFEEKVKGSIEPGKFADFVVMDTDLMQVDIQTLPDANIIMTFVHGEKVFQQPEQNTYSTSGLSN